MEITPGKPQQGTEDMLPAWRAAVAAYRDARRSGGGDEAAFKSAVAAFLKERPEVSAAEARAQVTRAINYAASEHTDWFWQR